MFIDIISGEKKQRIEAQKGKNLAHTLVEAGVLEGIECGRGICGKCAVRLHSGQIVPVKSLEETTKGCPPGHVLSCRSLLGEDDLVIEVLSAKDDIHRKVRLPNLGRNRDQADPVVKKVFIKLSPPTLEDQLSDTERLISALGKDVVFGYSVLANIPSTLRKSGFEVTAVEIDNELIAVEPGDTTAQNYGFIVDIGTTTVAIYLVDMNSGDAIDAEGLANPQRAFGADVLSRISASANDGQLQKMQELVVEGITEVFNRLLSRNGIAQEHVYSMVVVGNTTMSHLFLGVEPDNLAIAPFIPCYRHRIKVRGRDLQFPLHPAACVYVLANISGYVGSDTLGVAMATRVWELDGYSLAVDIGTNGEILLGSKNGLYSCSAAAGPAFEGAHIIHGMRAGQGAIEKIRLEDDQVKLKVIGNCPPIGICGSGLIDGVAELLRTGLLDSGGRFAKEGSPAMSNPLAARIRTGENGIREFVLAYSGEYGNASDIVISQKDIRELQLAKAAIAAGIIILCKEAKISAENIDRVFLAGAFGNYLDRDNAVALGVFPSIPVEKIIPVGNAAAEGAGICLLSLTELQNSDKIAASVNSVELSAQADFNNLWIRCINFTDPKVSA